jgi:uncharacterized protein (DUF2252 family)
LSKTSLTALNRLTDIVDGRRVIVEDPPLIVRLDATQRDLELARLDALYQEYYGTLPADRQHLLDRYSLTDVALKVVGVGSVGTRCFIALLESGDGEPLFLQVKEAVPSVLEAHLGPSVYPQAGQRVVNGQRIIQAASDPFLGWARFAGPQHDVDFFVRQLWDGKWSNSIESLSAKGLERHARACGGALGRAHARSGDAAMLTGYLGDDDSFDRAVTAWGEAYADRTAEDHRALVDG